MEVIINADCNDRSVLYFLSVRLNLSHRAISRLKRLDNGITLNGAHVTVRATLKEGDILSIMTQDTPQDTNPYVEPVFFELSVLYEDNDIVLINKPFGMPVHTSRGHRTDSLANALMYYYGDKPFVFRPVTRLDRDTSGVCLVAKTRESAARLSSQMASGVIRKKYIAMLDGHIFPTEGAIEGYIRREAESIITRCVCQKDEKGAKYAKTLYSLICQVKNMSLVSCTPLTGRTHQLRVHFKSVGHPIIGDSLYGSPSPLISRQALHAYSISFIHPVSAKEMTVTAPVSEDILSLCERKDINI